MLSLLRAPLLALYTFVFPSASSQEPQERVVDRRPAKVVEVPTSLIDVLAVPESSGVCHSVSHVGWRHDAEECTYKKGAVSWTITTATPSAERVARWIVDASSFIPSVDGLRERDHAAWEDALVVIAKQTIAQSGRVFPLDGVVWEDFEGLTGYVFHSGVTYGTFGGPLASCRACACRIDSLNRSEWCAYDAEVLQKESYDACLEHLGGERGWNDAWAERCVDNHDEAWTSDRNESLRAVAYFVERHQMGPMFPHPETADPSVIVEALARAYVTPSAITRAPIPNRLSRWRPRIVVKFFGSRLVRFLDGESGEYRGYFRVSRHQTHGPS